MKTTIHLIRHGAVHNPDNIYYGRLSGYRLSQRGREQARAAANLLCDAPLAAIFSSPQQRARETAEMIAAPHDGLSVQVESRIDEVQTPYDGRPKSELQARNFDLYTGSPPQYEQPADILQRAHRFFRQIREKYNGEQVAAVTHGDVVAFMVLDALQVRPIPRNKNRLQDFGLADAYPATASISTFTLSDDGETTVTYRRPSSH